MDDAHAPLGGNALKNGRDEGGAWSDNKHINNTDGMMDGRAGNNESKIENGEECKGETMTYQRVNYFAAG
jgi:hypothetical protein